MKEKMLTKLERDRAISQVATFSRHTPIIGYRS